MVCLMRGGGEDKEVIAGGVSRRSRGGTGGERGEGMGNEVMEGDGLSGKREGERTRGERGEEEEERKRCISSFFSSRFVPFIFKTRSSSSAVGFGISARYLNISK